MARLDKALETLFNLEYSSDSNILHKNRYENGFTCYGIYQSAHPNWMGWDLVKSYYEQNFNDIHKTSRALSKDFTLKSWVEDFYRENFWNVAKLDEVNSQHIAEEIFIFGVNVGMKIAIMKTQKLVGAYVDGIFGNKTLRAVNEFNVNEFDIKFDKFEQEYYEAIIRDKPYLAINKNGWYNRAVAV